MPTFNPNPGISQNARVYHVTDVHYHKKRKKKSRKQNQTCLFEYLLPCLVFG